MIPPIWRQWSRHFVYTTETDDQLCKWKAGDHEEGVPTGKKIWCVVVGLALDEDGIPDTVEGRLAIAEKIYKTGESYGIARKDIVIDALTMTMSTDSNSRKCYT